MARLSIEIIHFMKRLRWLQHRKSTKNRKPKSMKHKITLKKQITIIITSVIMTLSCDDSQIDMSGNPLFSASGLNSDDCGLSLISGIFNSNEYKLKLGTNCGDDSSIDYDSIAAIQFQLQKSNSEDSKDLTLKAVTFNENESNDDSTPVVVRYSDRTDRVLAFKDSSPIDSDPDLDPSTLTDIATILVDLNPGLDLDTSSLSLEETSSLCLKELLLIDTSGNRWEPELLEPICSLSLSGDKL